MVSVPRKGILKTFLLTSIENSANWWKLNPAGMQAAVSQHDSLTQTIVRENGGRVFKITGDSFFCVFDHLDTALICALEIQRDLTEQPWNKGAISLKAGIAIHTGAVEEVDGGEYRGELLDRTIALLAAANG